MADMPDVYAGSDAPTLAVVTSPVGRLSPEIGGWVPVKLNRNTVTKFLLDGYLDVVMTTPLGEILDAELGKNARPAMLGLSFGFPNGVYAANVDTLEGLKDIFYDGPRAIISWYSSTPAEVKTEQYIRLNAYALVITMALTTELRNQLGAVIRSPGEQARYSIRNPFKEAIKKQIAPLVTEFKNAAAGFVLTAMTEWQTGGKPPVHTIMNTFYPKYTKTFGGKLAVDVMGWNPKSDEYAFNGVGYMGATFIGYSAVFTAELVYGIGIAEGAFSLAKWVVRSAAQGRIGRFATILFRIPLKGANKASDLERLTTVQTLWRLTDALEGAGDAAKAAKILDEFAASGPAGARLGMLIQDITKFGDDVDIREVAQALGRIAKATDAGVFDETIVALYKVQLLAGKLSKAELEDVGFGIAKLQKLKAAGKTHGVDPLGFFGLRDDVLKPGLSKIGRLDDDVIENAHRAMSLKIFDDIDALPAVGEFLQGAKAAHGDVISGGGTFKLLAAARRPGVRTTIPGTIESVDGIYVLLQGKGGPGGIGWQHIFNRHVDGSELLIPNKNGNLLESSFFPTGRTVRVTRQIDGQAVTKTIEIPDIMTEKMVQSLIRDALKSPDPENYELPKDFAELLGITKIQVIVGTNPTLAGNVITAYAMEGPNVVKYFPDTNTFRKKFGSRWREVDSKGNRQ